MVRQHYALGNQDRILRLEFQQRYFELYGKRSDDVLLEKTLKSNISGDEIKKSIKNWKPDFHRV